MIEPLIPLRQCPFAQEDEEHEVELTLCGFGHPDRYQVVCSCGACGPEDLGNSGACEAWNTRPVEAQLLEACKIFAIHADWYYFYDNEQETCEAAIAAAEGTL